jgi:hypothetical protein
MRTFVIIVAISLFIGVGCVSTSHAVGYYAVGKEGCKCSPLVARGIFPDTLNLLNEVLVFPRFGGALERLAVGIREIFTQFAATPADVVSEPVTKKDPPVQFDEPTKVQKKVVPVDKSNKLKKEVKDPSKKKRLKVPPKTLQRS